MTAGKASRKDVVLSVPGESTPPSLAAAPSAAPAPATAMVPEALQAPEPGPENDTYTPLANVGYIGWMNGTPREKDPIFDTKFFTPEVRLDANYLQSLNHPMDHTIDGSTEEFRSSEFQLEQVSFGGDFHWNNVKARFLSMFGMFATTTPRNDASNEVGQWRFLGTLTAISRKRMAGYHFDCELPRPERGRRRFRVVRRPGSATTTTTITGTYQPWFVSSNTPWFVNGLRVQWWPTQNLKIEPWLINGWQSYAKFNRHPGFGGQILWIPSDSLKLVFNTYSVGQDNLNCQANASVTAAGPWIPCASPRTAAIPTRRRAPTRGRDWRYQLRERHARSNRTTSLLGHVWRRARGPWRRVRFPRYRRWRSA